MNNQRQTILDNIKQALQIPSQVSALYQQSQSQLDSEIKAARPRKIEDLWELFKNNLQEINGEFHLVNNLETAADRIGKFLKENDCIEISVSDEQICNSIAEKIAARDNKLKVVKAVALPPSQRKQKLAQIKFSLVEGSFAVADTGSVAVLYENSRTSYPHFLADTVIVIVNYSNITADLFELFERIAPTAAKDMVLITGPSRTADIEKILILGAHGPRQLIVLAAAQI